MLLDTVPNTTATTINISRLTLDILQLILEQLDTHSLSKLSQTCRTFHTLVRRELSFESARFYQRNSSQHQDLQHTTRRRRESTVSAIFPMSSSDYGGDEEQKYTTIDNIINNNNNCRTVMAENAATPIDGMLLNNAGPNIATKATTTNTTATTDITPTAVPLHVPPVYHQQSITRIDNKLYMPLMLMEPICFVYDIQQGYWQKHPLEAYPEYTPFVAPVVSIGSCIFMFGGRQVMTETLSNNVVVLDVETWLLKRIELTHGSTPLPRHDHTVNVLHQRYLLVFGGACSNSPGENDLYLFDTKENTWTEPKTHGQIPSARFGHAAEVLDNHLYIFGGCQIQSEWNMVHDVLYELDTGNWTWYKYDHPEAYYYRRGSSSDKKEKEIIINNNHDGDNIEIEIENPTITDRMMMQPASPTMPSSTMTTIAASLHRNLILETTGQPPCDRFYCTMQAIGSHKLLIFGGQTVRQDRDDNNVLHAHSLRSIDVFNIRRKHWSAVPTISLDGDPHTLYPQDVSCFLINNYEHFYQQDNNMNPHGYYTLLLIGQQRMFSTSSGESSYFSGTSSGGDVYTHTASTTTHHAPPLLGFDNQHMYVSTPQLPTIQQLPPFIHTRSSPPEPTLRRGASLSSPPPSFSPIPTASLQPSYIHTIQPHMTFTPETNNTVTPFHHSLDQQQRQRGNRRVLSRPMADYEGLLDLDLTNDEYNNLQHSTSTSMDTELSLYQTISGDQSSFTGCSSGNSNNNSFISGGRSNNCNHHIANRQQYSLEPLCIILALDHDY